MDGFGKPRRSHFKISPAKVRFTHDSVAMYFHRGLPINKTCEEIAKGKIKIDAFPVIRVLNWNGTYYSADNRRLYVFRVLNVLGLLHQIEVTNINSSLCNFEKFTTQNNGCHVFVRSKKNNNGRWMKVETYRHCKCSNGKNKSLPKWWNKELKCHVSLVHLNFQLPDPAANLARFPAQYSISAKARNRLFFLHNYDYNSEKKRIRAWPESAQEGINSRSNSGNNRGTTTATFNTSALASRHFINDDTKENRVAVYNSNPTTSNMAMNNNNILVISSIPNSWSEVTSEQFEDAANRHLTKTDDATVASLPSQDVDHLLLEENIEVHYRRGLPYSKTPALTKSQAITQQHSGFHSADKNVEGTNRDKVAHNFSKPVNISFSDSTATSERKNEILHVSENTYIAPEKFKLPRNKAVDEVTGSYSVQEKLASHISNEYSSLQSHEESVTDSILSMNAGQLPIVTQPSSLLKPASNKTGMSSDKSVIFVKSSSELTDQKSTSINTSKIKSRGCCCKGFCVFSRCMLPSSNSKDDESCCYRYPSRSCCWECCDCSKTQCVMSDNECCNCVKSKPCSNCQSPCMLCPNFSTSCMLCLNNCSAFESSCCAYFCCSKTQCTICSMPE